MRRCAYNYTLYTAKTVDCHIRDDFLLGKIVKKVRAYFKINLLESTTRGQRDMLMEAHPSFSNS